jgi:hypothetical protein
MKFLVLFAFILSSILAVYFISGCGDDTTNITTPGNTDTLDENTDTLDDNVIGSVQGIVTDIYDNTALSGVVVSWTKNDHAYTATTNANGYYLIDDSLSSGYFNLTFTRTGYTIVEATIYIPTIEEIRGGTSDEAAGDEEYMETTDVALFPLTGTITGTIYTTLPDQVGKDGGATLALDGPDPDLVSRAAGVDVVLDYSGFFAYWEGYDYYYDRPFQLDKFEATTDANGVYTFTNVPLVLNQYFWDAAKADAPDMATSVSECGIKLLILPFTIGDSSYAYSEYSFCMIPGTTTLPNLFVPLVGSGDGLIDTDQPVILTYNFEQPGFLVGDDLIFTFSKPMDSVTFEFDIDFESDDFGIVWSNTYRTLTIDPALDLCPDESYNIELWGKSADGLELYAGWFDEYLYTQQGMRFVSTNLDDYDEDFTDFPLASSITLTFDMNVDLTNEDGYVTLYDTEAERQVNATVTAVGPTVTINPAEDLESDRTYMLDFVIYSTLPCDAVNDNEITGYEDLTFTTVNTIPAPGAVSGFAIDMGTGWTANYNTLSIDFKWNSTLYADYYEIYAMDNRNNTDFIIVADDVDHLDYNQWQEGTVNLGASFNNQFDLFFDDAIQTPFSDGIELTFRVRAVNAAGAGAFSNTITIGDETAPTFTVTQTGDADNAANEDDGEFYLNMTQTEYVDSIHFVFVEAGGDPEFLLEESDVEWDWDNDMRDGDGVVTVEGGATGSADQLIVNIWDNSGNMGVDTIMLTPWIEITYPNAETEDFVAPSYNIQWSSVDPNGIYDYLDLYLSLDGGATWIDTIQDTPDDGIYSYAVSDTWYSTEAVVGLQDTTDGGGWIWTSEEFTWIGIELTAPDSATYDTMTYIYDRGGIDSTGIPIEFGSAGIDSAVIIYSLTGGAGTYTNISDTIEIDGATTTYTWYPADRGANYTCYIGIRDLDASRPIHTFSWAFGVTHDYVDITDPLSGCIAGGDTYTITWDTVYKAASSQVGLEYSVDDGDSWVTIAASTANDGSYDWAVPATTPSDDEAWVRMIDRLGNNVLDVDGYFSISGIVLDSPTVDSDWLGGSSHNIEWTTICTPGLVTLYYSHDNFDEDSTLIVAATADDGNHVWSVPEQADSTVWVRAYTNTDATYTTAGPFIISGVQVTAPNGGETLSSGGTYTIQWETIGDVDSVGIHYSVNGGGWLLVVNDLPNAGSYSWTVPNNPSTSVNIRVGKNDTFNGSDVNDDPFTIAGIIVTYPNGGETFTLGVPEDITWEEIAITSDIKIEYTLNGGADWYPIPGATGIAAETLTFNWDLDTSGDPNLEASALCLIRVSEDDADPMSDASNTPFTIEEVVK